MSVVADVPALVEIPAGPAGDGAGVIRSPRPSSVPARRVWPLWLLGAGIGAAIVYGVSSSAGGFGRALAALADGHPAWVALGLACEAVSFVAFGSLLRRLLGPAAGVSRPNGVRLALVLLGLGNVLPASPAEGLALAAVELRRRGVPRRRTRLSLGLAHWYTTRAALVLVALNAVVVAGIVQLRRGSLPARLSAVAGPALAVLAGVTLVAWLLDRRRTAEWVAVVAGRARFWRRPFSVDEARAAGAAWWDDAQEALGGAGNRRTVLGIALAAVAADALCLVFSLWAAGAHPRPGAFLILYGAVMVASLVPLLPGGLGAVETIVPALLHHGGTPVATGLAAVLVYRALGTVLPALAGGLSLAQLRVGRRRRRLAAAPSSVSAAASAAVPVAVPAPALLAGSPASAGALELGQAAGDAFPLA